MKIFKMLILTAVATSLYAHQPQQEQVGLVVAIEPKGIRTPIAHEVAFLYDFYNKAMSDAGSDKTKSYTEFIKSVLNNEQGMSLDECIALLKRDQQYLKEALDHIDRIYYSSRNLSKGLMLGAFTLGGLVVAVKGAQWMRDLNDMYSQEQEVGGYIEAGLLEKVKSLRPGSFFRKGFVTGEEAKEIEATYKNLGIAPPVHATYQDLVLDAIDKYGLSPTFAPEQTKKAIQEAGGFTSDYVSAGEKAKSARNVRAATVGGAALYGASAVDFIRYVENAYKAYQANKENRNKVLKAMEQNEKMLQLLQAVEL